MTDSDEVLSWRAAILAGVLWGVVVTFASTITQPLFGLGLAELLSFVLQLLVQWCVTGVAWALGARLCRGRWLIPKVALLSLATFLVAFGVQWLVARSTAAGDDASNPVFGTVPVMDLSVYIAWLDLFYGGLYLAGYLSMRRTAIIRRQLAGYRLAHSQADNLLRESRVSAYRGQLQPAMLLSALAALKAQYATDRKQADLLFDRLIAFLRAAMPSVRSGVSTLGAEFETLRSYAMLLRCLPATGARWKLDLDGVIPALPFPSLVLLPALDAIGSTLPDEAELFLSVTSDANAVLLRLEASASAALPEMLDERLRAGLALTFGRAASLSQGPELPLSLRLPVMIEQTHSTGDDDETFVANSSGNASHEPLLRR